MENKKQNLIKKIAKVQKELDKLGIVDVRDYGWGTQRYANAMRKLEYLSMEKTKLLFEYEDLTGENFADNGI